MKMKLSREQWKIVDDQCKFCTLWSEKSGCTFPKGMDNEPVEDCLVSIVKLEGK